MVHPAWCHARAVAPAITSWRQAPPMRAMSLIRERYADFGPALAAEKLQERHGVILSKETVRSL